MSDSPSGKDYHPKHEGDHSEKVRMIAHGPWLRLTAGGGMSRHKPMRLLGGGLGVLEGRTPLE